MNLQATKEMLIEASEAIAFFCRMLDQSGDLTNILGMVGIALLTIFIPVAIELFKDTGNYQVLDKNVILDQAVKARRFLFYLALIYLPLILWGGASSCWRLVLLGIWTLGIYFICDILKNLYNWKKGNKFDLRFKFLEKTVMPEDMEASWASVWQTKNINSENEREFFRIFFDAIDKLLQSNKHESIRIAVKLLNDFNNLIDNRLILFPVYSEESFPKILKLHFDVWKKHQTVSYSNDTLYQMLITINAMLRKIEEHAFKEGKNYSFFKVFNKHIEKNKDNEEYIKYIMDIFYGVFFDTIDSFPEKNEIWEQFPKEWKIAKDTLENNIAVKMTWVHFFKWAEGKIRIPNIKDIDHSLYGVAFKIFPYSVNPVLLVKLLVLAIWRPSHENNRMKSFIEYDMNYFGFTGRGSFFRADRKGAEEIAKEKEVKQEKAALELAIYLFGHVFTAERLEKYINELEQLTDQNEDKETCKNFIRIFTQMKKMIN